MKNYVALHARSGEVYGIAICETDEDSDAMVNFAEDNNIRITLGTLHEPGNLIMHARMSMLLLSRSTPLEAPDVP